MRGAGKPADVPAWLNWELWQGPAPRKKFHDNFVHYNWHWFRHWGTGEACNNATHELDVARWALGVEYPNRVLSSGGRYHFKDDWEFFDTQVMSFEFPGGKSITWEGQSCNALKIHDRGRGTTIHGSDGTLLVDRDGWVLHDPGGTEIKRNVRRSGEDATNTVGADALTDLHAANFIDSVRSGAVLNQPISNGQKSVLLCHLGNIAQFTGRVLRIDPKSGRILGDAQANRMWKRSYEPGWAPRV